MCSLKESVDSLPFSSRTPRKRICDLPPEDQPLYRLHQLGRSALATAELLALVLGTPDAPGLAEELLTAHGSLWGLARTSPAKLQRFQGIGEAQAARLMAMLELSQRLQVPPADSMTIVASPADAAQLLMPRLQHQEQEIFCIILLNTRNKVLSIRELYKGSLNTSVIRVGEVFKAAIEGAAAAIIVAHNHPSGDAQPSPEDVAVTRQIVKAGRLLDIPCLDHVIIGHHYVSLKESGFMSDQ